MAKSSLTGTSASRSGSVDRTPVKGGWIKRESSTGRFVEVGSDSGTYRSKPKSVEAASEAAEKRSAALKRLADR
jgi:hypothetical protein